MRIFKFAAFLIAAGIVSARVFGGPETSGDTNGNANGNTACDLKATGIQVFIAGIGSKVVTAKFNASRDAVETVVLEDGKVIFYNTLGTSSKARVVEAAEYACHVKLYRTKSIRDHEALKKEFDPEKAPVQKDSSAK